MRALAELLRGFGVRVTGSDRCIPSQVFWKMHRAGIRASQGHAACQLPPEADVLIYSPAVGADNPERAEAERRGIRQLSLSAAIGRIMNGREGISIVGTHGKTTTTAMLGHVLDVARKSPSVLTGAEVIGRGTSGWAGRGKHFVVESCEYRRHFLDLSPRHAILLNIEPDHFDCFETFQATINAYRAFTVRLPSNGTLLVNYDCPAALEAAQGTSAKVETFGSRAGADWWVANITQSEAGWRFRVYHHAKHYADLELLLPGRHNILNALPVIAMGDLLGLDRRQIAQGLSTFRGVARRFERLGSWRGMTVVDDYAHHPTAVRVTLRTARQCFPGRRVWCVFQPHQVSRTRALLNDFVRTLKRADRVLVCPVFAAREPQGDEQWQLSARIARRISRRGTSARFVESLDRIRPTLETEAKPGDVVLFLGAGDIDRIGGQLVERRQQAS